MDRFDTYETFIAVVETGQFAAAAARLGVANSVVSRRIAELETRLGVQLLQRTTRTLSLTDAGRELYPRAQRLLAELEETEQAVGGECAALTGVLRLSAPLAFARMHLFPVLQQFMHDHPGLRLDLQLDDRFVNLVEGGIDLAVRIGTLEDSNLVARPLAKVNIMVCASPAYLNTHGVPETPEALATHQGLLYTNMPDPGLWEFLDAQGHKHVVRIAPRFQSNNGELLLQAAVEGLGVVQQPSFLIYQEVLAGRLVPLLTDYPCAPVQAYAVYPSRRFVPQRTRLFIEALREALGEEPYWDQGLAFG